MNSIGAFSHNTIGMPMNSGSSSMGNSKNNSYNNYQSKSTNNYGQNAYYANSGKKLGFDFSASDKNKNEYNTKTKRLSQTLEVTTYTDKEGRVHKTFTGKGTDVVESMKKAEEKNKDKKAKAKKHLDYSFQRVSSQVIMAKNSLSASKAVIAARRSLSDLKRKLQTVDCSEDEKAAALAHATRMLRIARKKKNNLEMEELIKTTMQTDERNEKFNQAAEAISGLFEDDEKKEHKEIDILDMIKGGSEEGEDKEEKKTESIDYAELSGDLMSAADIEETYDSEDLEEDISDDLEELTEETIKEMADEMSKEMSEELKDMMSLMEVIDPHMNKEQFEKLKTKHRCEEQKEIVKADMEYLKAYLKSVQDGKSSGSENDGKPVVGTEITTAFQAGAESNDLSQIVQAGIAATTGMSDTSLGFSFGA